MSAQNPFDSFFDDDLLKLSGNSTPLEKEVLVSLDQPQPQKSESFDDQEEGPILEQLGIDVQEIKQRFKKALSMEKINADYLKEMDLTGPIVVALLLALSQSLRGSIKFGEIYGASISGAIILWFMFNVLSDNSISLYTVSSVIGYALTPFLLLGGMNLLLSSRLVSWVGFICAVWSTRSAGTLLESGLQVQRKSMILRYPILLFYMTFILIILF